MHLSHIMSLNKAFENSVSCLHDEYETSFEYNYIWTIGKLQFNDLKDSTHMIISDSRMNPWHVNIFTEKSDEKEFLSMTCNFDREAFMQIGDNLQYLIIYIQNLYGEQEVYADYFIDQHHDYKWVINKFFEKKNMVNFTNSKLTLKFKMSFFCKSDTAFKCSNKFINVERMLNNEEFSDMKIVIDDKECYVHKLILASQSPIFAAMFKHNMKEKNNSVIEISDISYEIMQGILHFLYIGKVNNIADIASDLLVAADKYQIQELKKICEYQMSYDLNVDNVISALVFAEKYGANILKERSIQFFVSHVMEIIHSDKYNAELCLISPLLSDLIKALVRMQNIEL